MRQHWEPEGAVVVLAALVYAEELVMAVPGKKFDATGLPQLAGAGIEDLIQFKHIARPKDWNLPALKALFELLGLTPGMAQLVTQEKDDPVKQLQKAIGDMVKRLMLAQQSVQTGLIVWRRHLIADEENQKLRTELEESKSFLESLQPFNSPGKLKNFRYDAEEVKSHGAGLKALETVETLQGLVGELNQSVTYISQAEAVLSAESDWAAKAKAARDNMLGQLDDPQKRSEASFRQKARWQWSSRASTNSG